MIRLRTLEVSNNQISDVQVLENLGEIESVKIRGNPLNCAEQSDILRALGDDVVDTRCAAGDN
jgi:hypothetical protein